MMKSLDLQKFVIDYLNNQDFEGELEDTTVGGVRPSTEKNLHPYVVVLATGGPGLSHRILYTAQITIDSYAPTTWWAGELARRVGDAIHQLPEADGPIAVVSSPAPTEMPDPDTDMRRYTATYQITAKLGVTNG